MNVSNAEWVPSIITLKLQRDCLELEEDEGVNLRISTCKEEEEEESQLNVVEKEHFKQNDPESTV